jgi:predicted enzyme related to lactoylglutathione lyase
MSLLQRVDAVQVPVPSLDEGLRFYAEALGHHLKWRNDAIGQAGLALPDGDSELVLTTTRPYEPNWLVADVPTAIETITHSGGTLITGPIDIPVGRAAVIQDPFGNHLVLVDLSMGLYTTNPDGTVVEL